MVAAVRGDTSKHICFPAQPGVWCEGSANIPVGPRVLVHDEIAGAPPHAEVTGSALLADEALRLASTLRTRQR